MDDPIAPAAFATEAYMAGSPQYAEAVRRDAERRLAVRLTSEERATLRATSDILGGSCAPTIIEMANSRAADLIVMGTHGRTGLAHALLGSIAERVVRTAPCPVLTVRARRHAVRTPARGRGDGALVV